jgi:hypothetical protein
MPATRISVNGLRSDSNDHDAGAPAPDDLQVNSGANHFIAPDTYVAMMPSGGRRC